MSRFLSVRSVVALALGLCTVASSPTFAAQDNLLVADRLSNSVYRYKGDGTLAGRVLIDNANLNQPAGIALSPDASKLYVASSQNNRVMQYDYHIATNTATNPIVFADATDGLIFPNGIKFSQDGSKIYVSNLGGSGVAQFNTDGSSAGAPISGLIGGGAFFQFSGMAYAPTGELLVGGFQDFPAGANGTVAKSNLPISALSDFVSPSPAIWGASGLLVHNNDLYVSGLFAGTVRRFNATTGAVDGAFAIDGLGFPQDLINSPDGSGFLAGILGFTDGSGNISHYGFDGTLLGIFATPGGGGVAGFKEPTAFAALPVPEPATAITLIVALTSLVLAGRRRKNLG